MKQNVIIAAIVSGALCFAIGFVGSTLLTMPNREKTDAAIAAAETKALEAQTAIQEKAQQEIQSAKAETKQLQNKLKQVAAERNQAEVEQERLRELNFKLVQQSHEKDAKLDSLASNVIREIDKEVDKTIQELLAEKAIHSINAKLNEVRIDPLAWSMVALEDQQGLALVFSSYFEARGSSTQVKILSSHSDAVLATYSAREIKLLNEKNWRECNNGFRP